MRQIYLILLFFFLFPIALSAQQFNSQGHPFITNYTAEDYNGTEQTWCIVQDDRGVMYFGSGDSGILEYDGVKWRKISVPDNKIVYSLAKGHDGIIYVGSSGNFGYLEPQKDGKLEYVSLSEQLEDTLKNKFTHIFKTYSHKNKIYFCSNTYIFVYNGKTVEAISLGDRNTYACFLTFFCNDRIFIGSWHYGLLTLKNNELSVAPGAKVFERKNIYSMLRYSDKENLIITNGGFYLYNPTTGESNPFRDSNGFIKRMIDESIIPYNSVSLNNHNFGIGNVQTDWLSFFELTPHSNPVSIVSKSIGLQSSQVTALLQNNDAPIWLTLFDGGVSKVELNSSLRKFSKESGIDDLITDIIRFKGTLYISTFNGVYFLTSDKNGIARFEPVKNIAGTVWDLLEFKTSKDKSILLAGSYTDGLYEIRKEYAHPISAELTKRFDKVQHNVFSLYQSKINPETLYIGLIGLLGTATWGDGWVDTRNFQEDKIKFDIRSIAEDKHGNLWLSSELKGIHVFTPKGQYIDFSKHKDLANISDLYFFNSRDSLFIISSKGILYYNYEDSSFVKGGLPSPYSNTKGIFRIQSTKYGYALLCYDENSGKYWTELVEKDSSKNWTVSTIPFQRLPNKWSDALYVDDDGTIWIGMSKELYSYNPKVARSYAEPYRTLIRKVVAKDSLLFDGSFYAESDSGRILPSLEQQSSQIYRLGYKYNGVVINFAAPFFEKENEIVYSHYLEGSDETAWGKWDKRTEATYTNLREGRYTFWVKARNIYGNESIAASYTFEITPPWYRTILAFLLYLILFVLLVWAIVKWNTRRLIAEKEHLEHIVKERTAEVVAQKEEIEVQNEKIAAQNEEIKSSIHYASRIQNAILPPNEQIDKVFPESFILYLPRDIVSGDFYYITQVGNKKISVVADCTGHGVPGGFMSMLGVSFLTQIISQTENLHAATILNKLRQLVINALHQTGEIGGSKDGMDLALYIFDEQTMQVEFAGANNPLIHISNGELTHIKGDKMPIGIHLRGDTSFTNVEVEVKKGDVLYTFSDGYADQFGGGDARKFMIKNLKDLLLSIHQKPMDEQRDILEKTLLSWHGDTPRIDDVVVMGVRI